VEETFIWSSQMPRRQVSAKSALAFDLKADRKKHKISQVEAAKILCVTQPTVARWEQSGGMPHIYRVVWNIHWKQLEQADNGHKVQTHGVGVCVQNLSKVKTGNIEHESQTHSDNESPVARSGRNRRSNVIELRARKVVGRRKSDGDAVANRSASNRESFARRESIDSIDSKNNRLRIKEIPNGIDQSTATRVRSVGRSVGKADESEGGNESGNASVSSNTDDSKETLPANYE
jgi:hypothetical protein